jgi:hypothetical protein
MDSRTLHCGTANTSDHPIAIATGAATITTAAVKSTEPTNHTINTEGMGAATTKADAEAAEGVQGVEGAEAAKQHRGGGVGRRVLLYVTLRHPTLFPLSKPPIPPGSLYLSHMPTPLPTL